MSQMTMVCLLTTRKLITTKFRILIEIKISIDIFTLMMIEPAVPTKNTARKKTGGYYKKSKCSAMKKILFY